MRSPSDLQTQRVSRIGINARAYCGHTIDPNVAIDVVHGAPRAIPRPCAMSCSSGFRGANTVLVVGPQG